LHLTDIKCFEVLKESETNKIKAYVGFLQSNSDVSEDEVALINNLPELKISQKTPLRVLHRRT